MFMRKFMNRLGLGYQCHYTNRKEKNYRYNNSYPGRWWIEIWDQRPGHYTQSDELFHIVGPEFKGKSGKEFNKLKKKYQIQNG